MAKKKKTNDRKKFWYLPDDLFKNTLFHTTGKDTIIFATKDDHAAPSTAELVEEDPNDPFEERGEKR